MVQRQHNVSEPVPPFYIQTLVSLEGSLNTAVAKEKEAKKKMNATNAKALTAVKQKVKKALKEYEGEVKKFQEVRIFPGLHVLHRTSTLLRIRRLLNVNIPPLSPLSRLHLDDASFHNLEMTTCPMTLPPSEREAR